MKNRRIRLPVHRTESRGGLIELSDHPIGNEKDRNDHQKHQKKEDQHALVCPEHLKHLSHDYSTVLKPRPVKVTAGPKLSAAGSGMQGIRVTML